MAENRRFRSLTWRLLTVLCLSAVAAVGCFILCHGVGGLLIDRVYCAPSRWERRCSAYATDFRGFVQRHNASSGNAPLIGSWNRDNPAVRLTVTGRSAIITSDATGAEVVVANSPLSLRTGDAPVYAFTVNFSDGPCAVSLYDFSHQRLYTTADVAAVTAAAVLFLLSITAYHQKVTRSILRLSRQVRQVSQGDLQMQIIPQTADEIGQLAEDVDTMRLSIMEKLRREEEAWQANSQLITAISHDVRTPLTALLGYLDLLTEENLPPETKKAYLDICLHNAKRLKSLTDELFRFFLVFGQPEPEQHLEELDAATLMEQLLFEAEAELSQEFAVELDLSEELSGKLRVDVEHLRRVFDNLFSNLRKYADKREKVVISQTVSENRLEVTVKNTIAPQTGKTESTKIGLKTCEKLLTAMGGAFHQKSENGVFTAQVVLPLYDDKGEKL